MPATITLEEPRNAPVRTSDRARPPAPGAASRPSTPPVRVAAPSVVPAAPTPSLSPTPASTPSSLATATAPPTAPPRPNSAAEDLCAAITIAFQMALHSLTTIAADIQGNPREARLAATAILRMRIPAEVLAILQSAPLQPATSVTSITAAPAVHPSAAAPPAPEVQPGAPQVASTQPPPADDQTTSPPVAPPQEQPGRAVPRPIPPSLSSLSASSSTSPASPPARASAAGPAPASCTGPPLRAAA